MLMWVLMGYFLALENLKMSNHMHHLVGIKSCFMHMLFQVLKRCTFGLAVLTPSLLWHCYQYALCFIVKLLILRTQMKMQAGNPFLDQNFLADSCQPSPNPVPMPCATEYQHHPHSFRLPASSPYDNFLKAAGC